MSLWTEHAWTLIANGATWQDVEAIYLSLAASISHATGFLLG